MPTPRFSDHLQQLPSTQHLAGLELIDESGQVVDTLHNRPGQAGSVAVYAALALAHGGIDAAAALQGLHWFAEHTQAARAHPGSHPNIDRLLALQGTQRRYTVRCLPAA